MIILSNFPLIAAFTAILLAQMIKVPLGYVAKRTWNMRLSFSTGGMPSSHSAAVTSLSTAIGIGQGVTSASFAISAILSVIIMFDAAGIRRHAGEQAVFLNQLVADLQHMFQPGQERKALKEFLGHRPIEVIVGGWFGIGVSVLIYAMFYR